MSDSNTVYLRGWMRKPLHCPFCGEKIFPTPVDEYPGIDACEHQLLDMSEGILWYVSDEFVAILNQLHGLSQEVIDDVDDARTECFMESCNVETLDGVHSAQTLVEEVVDYLERERVPFVIYKIDIGEDLVTQVFCL